jgi:multidrug efflux pump subunit AcrB
MSTALSTVVALVPIAVLGADHAGLAAAVVGGVLTATVFTLVALPLGYAAVLGLRRR